MSESVERPDWQRMHPDQFSTRTTASQDALFLTDDTDSCGTETFDGFGFGASLHGAADQVAEPLLFEPTARVRRRIGPCPCACARPCGCGHAGCQARR